MTDEEYKTARLVILEDFYRDMQQRLGLQEPVKASLNRTARLLGQLNIDQLAEAGGH